MLGGISCYMPDFERELSIEPVVATLGTNHPAHDVVAWDRSRDPGEQHIGRSFQARMYGRNDLAVTDEGKQRPLMADRPIEADQQFGAAVANGHALQSN